MELLGVGTPMMWAGFLLFVVLMLALDLGVFHRTSHTVTAREALGFSGLVHYGFGADKAMEFLTGYAIEKALAIDNIFVFVAVFGAFAVPAAYQHRVLFYGVLGALAMRAAFIFAGSALIMRFHWVLYVFGALLLLTGVRMLTAQGGPPEDVSKNRLLVVLRDSIPAIFAVTTDPFIVFTSNIFAILGLRSMYFLLADLVPRFVYLKVGLALVLMFVGFKMLIMEWVKLPTPLSLGVVLTLVVGSILVSLRVKPAEAPTLPRS